MKLKKTNNSKGLDPLYVIFEHHLNNFHDSNIDRRTFIANIIHDYLGHLRKQKIAIPRELEGLIAEELYDQVNTMLVKKIYGFFTIDEYQKTITTDDKKKARKKYSTLKDAEKKTAAKKIAG